MRSDWSKDLTLSVEKIATLKDITFRRGFEAFLRGVTVFCGVWLFSMMEADSVDQTTVDLTAITGFTAIGLSSALEIYSSIAAQNKRHNLEVDRASYRALADVMGARADTSLQEGQSKMFARCMKFFKGDGAGEGWEVLKSPDADVEMWTKCFEPESGERSGIATGKAIGVVNCSAEEVAAWVFDYCSNERMRINAKEGNPSRFELMDKKKINEATFATVKAFPFFLENREFVFRQLWKSEEGKVFIALESVDDEVDYGVRLRKTRATTRGMYQIENVPDRKGLKRCQVTLAQQMDLRGYFPMRVINQLLPSVLSDVQEAIDEFRRVESCVKMSADTESPKLHDEVEIMVDECSWVYLLVNLLLTSVYSIIWVCYAVTLKDMFESIGDFVAPPIITYFILTLAMKPKRTDVGYKRFIDFHFISFVIVAELAAAVGNFRKGLIFHGCFSIFRILPESFLFKQCSAVRKAAAKLPPKELSEFLCQTVLVKGTAALGPMLFFALEIISCFISQKSIDNGQCKNVANASLWLSIYLATLTCMSLFTKSAPKTVQRATAWEDSAVATLKLKWWQQVQGVFFVLTAISSLYLFSWIGVEGDANGNIYVIGALGGVSVAVACLIGAVTTLKKFKEHENCELAKLHNNLKSERKFSANSMQDEFVIATFV